MKHFCSTPYVRGLLVLAMACVLGGFSLSTTSFAADAGVTPNTQVLLDYGAGEYRYSYDDPAKLTTQPNRNFQQPTFDDSAWQTGSAAFGSGGDCPLQKNDKTTWPVLNELFVRRQITIPDGATKLRVMAEIDNDAIIYFDGTPLGPQISHENCPVKDEFRFDNTGALTPGTHTLAAYVKDRGVMSFFDMRVLAEKVPVVSKIQWKLGGNYVDVPTPFYVPTGVQLTFKAIPSPQAPWPSGKPTWSGNLVSGSGETQTVTPSSLGQKTISATCGGTVSINLVVYDIKPVLTPVDNFDGRSTDQFGVGEPIQLSAQILTADPAPTPGPSSSASYQTRGRRSLIRNVGYQLVQASTAPSVSASDIGGLSWQMDSGDGTLTDGGSLDGSGSYTVGDSVGAFTLDLGVSSGPFAGFSRIQFKKQVAPTGATFYKVPGGYADTTGFYHRKGTQSAGFNAAIRLTPSNVSFSGVQVREESCTPIVTNALRTRTDNSGTLLPSLNHPVGGWRSISPSKQGLSALVDQNGPILPKLRLPSSIVKGPWVAAIDGIQMGDFTYGRFESWGAGTFTWNIPWSYKVGRGSSKLMGFTATHFFQTYAVTAGTSEISKAGEGPYGRLADDPDSDLPF